jgi:hypothetical protein
MLETWELWRSFVKIAWEILDFPQNLALMPSYRSNLNSGLFAERGVWDAGDVFEEGGGVPDLP